MVAGRRVTSAFMSLSSSSNCFNTEREEEEEKDVMESYGCFMQLFISQSVFISFLYVRFYLQVSVTIYQIKDILNAKMLTGSHS